MKRSRDGKRRSIALINNARHLFTGGMLLKKRLLYSLSGLGLVSLLVLGTSALGSKAEAQCPDPHSPVRGPWSFSEVHEVTAALGGKPSTEVGVFTVDACGNLTGSGTVNTPCAVIDSTCPIPNPLVFTFNGTITTNDDGTAGVSVTAFGQTFSRACVLMNKQGACYQELRCVDTVPGSGDVIMLEVRRQLAGTCR